MGDWCIDGDVLTNCITGESRRTIAIVERASDSWESKQNASLNEYMDEQEKADPETETYYALFDAYICRSMLSHEPTEHLNKKHLILDVGCGISPTPPPYVNTIYKHNSYVGLDPYAVNMNREYMFINARLEDMEGLFTSDVKFNVFVFSTSLDHFENIAYVASIVKKFAAPGALCLFFMGLHDPALVAQVVGAKLLGKVFEQPNPLARMFELVSMALWKLPKIYLQKRIRARKLRAGEALDDKHYHYFTSNNLQIYLNTFGTIENIVRLPQTNICFATVKIPSC